MSGLKQSGIARMTGFTQQYLSLIEAGQQSVTFKTMRIHSTNPMERVNSEIKRRTDVVGIFPNEAALTRLVGAILLEQNDEWAVQRRYMSLETLAPISDVPAVSLLAVAA
jgi:transposase-like protein